MDDVRVEQYDSGVILRGKDGRFLPGTTAKHTITQADASTLARARWRKTEEAVGAAVLREIGSFADVPLNAPRDALAYLAGRQAIILADTNRPAMDDLEKLGQLMGDVPRTVDLRQQAQADPAPAQAGQPVLVLLVTDLLRARVVGAEVIDADAQPAGDE